MDAHTFNDESLEAELERRLELMTSPDYQDPAREDFTGRDLLALAGLVLVLSVVFFVWGY